MIRKKECPYENGLNFFNEDKESFECLRNSETNKFHMQLAWKVDDCTVAILEWNQNNNIFDKAGDGDTIEGIDFYN